VVRNPLIAPFPLQDPPPIVPPELLPLPSPLQVEDSCSHLLFLLDSFPEGCSAFSTKPAGPLSQLLSLTENCLPSPPCRISSPSPRQCCKSSFWLTLFLKPNDPVSKQDSPFSSLRFLRVAHFAFSLISSNPRRHASPPRSSRPPPSRYFLP